MFPNLQTILVGVAAAVLFSALSGALGYSKGVKAEKKNEAVRAAAQAEVIRLRERVLTTRLSASQTAAEKEKRNAVQANANYHAAVLNGTVSVSVPIASGVPAAAGASAPQARAQLDPAAAVRIDSIVNDGDDAIRELNQCIDAYNAARDAVNGVTNGHQ